MLFLQFWRDWIFVRFWELILVVCILLWLFLIPFLEKTLEYIERKAADKAASSVEREAGQVERAVEEDADDAYRSTRKTSRPRHYSSYDDDDNDYEDTQSQANYATCPYCNGGGIVYATDMYGNVLVDYYGNPQTITCGNCGGSGQVIVYQ